MFALLRTKKGLLAVAAWFAAWLTLEMVFFGEPMFRYSTSPAGYSAYIAELGAVAAAALLVVGRRPSARLPRDERLPAIVGAAGTVALFAVYATTFAPESFPSAPVLCACSIAHALCSVCLLCMLSRWTMALVFEHGLRQSLVPVLLGIALSFLLLPRFLRDTAYGVAVVGTSPLVMGVTLLAGGTAWRGPSDDAPAAPDGAGETDDPSRRVRVLASLSSLALLSLFMYLISYFDFIAPAGFRVVVDENPYFYLFVFVLLATLLGTLAFSGSERVFTSKLFLYILFGMMMLTMLVFFGVLSYVFSGGDYMYDLTKLLRRFVKISMLFVLVVLMYQHSLSPERSFAGVIVLPLVLAKLVQMLVVTVPQLHSFVSTHQYLYLSSIGFLSIAAWSLLLVSYVQGNTLFNAAETGDGRADPALGGTDLPEGVAQKAAETDRRDPSSARAVAERYELTERESDVLGYLASGYSLKAISAALCVSQNTVKTHVTSIYRKTGVHSRQEVIELVNPAAP